MVVTYSLFIFIKKPFGKLLAFQKVWRSDTFPLPLKSKKERLGSYCLTIFSCQLPCEVETFKIYTPPAK